MLVYNSFMLSLFRAAVIWVIFLRNKTKPAYTLVQLLACCTMTSTKRSVFKKKKDMLFLVFMFLSFNCSNLLSVLILSRTKQLSFASIPEIVCVLCRILCRGVFGHSAFSCLSYGIFFSFRFYRICLSNVFARSHHCIHSFLRNVLFCFLLCFISILSCRYLC